MVLTRFACTPFGTFGRLRIGDFECYTVERPWLDNLQSASCIPAGVYPVQLCMYNRGGYEAIEVCDVPGRSEIKFHVGNTLTDVHGCIAPGLRLGYVDGKWAVTSSKDTFAKLMAQFRTEKPTSIVIDPSALRGT